MSNPLHGGFLTIIQTFVKEQKESQAKNRYNQGLIQKIDKLLKDMMDILYKKQSSNPSECPKNSFHTVFKLHVMKFFQYDPEIENLLFSIPFKTL